MKYLSMLCMICFTVSHAADPYLGNVDDVEILRQASSQRPPRVKWNGNLYDVYNSKSIPCGKMVNAQDPSDTISTPLAVLEVLEVTLTDYQRKKIMALEEKQSDASPDDKGCCIIL